MKKALLHKFTFLFAAVLGTTAANAQLVDCNIYLKGNYMEVGLNNNGAVGTSYTPPSGYHPNSTDTMYNDCTTFSFNSITGLGFVADPNQDGWSTGTPAYFGDFVMPRRPREGWGVSDIGASATAYSYHYASSSSGFTGPLTGGSVAYTTSGTLMQGVWSGTFSGADTIDITQTVTIDLNGLFMLVHVDFTNISTTSTDTLYYIRTVNPQNESISASNDSTTNIVEYQLPNPAGLVVVSAKGLTNPFSYMGLGTKDPRAKCFIIKDSTLPGFVPFSTIYSGDPTHYAYNDSLTDDVGMGLIFKLVIGPGPGPGTSLDYAYSFKGGILDTLFDSLITLHTQGVAKAAAVQVYPNPTNDVVNITGLHTGDDITLYDIMGRQLQHSTAAISQSSQTISTAHLAPGLYMLAVKDARGNTRTRVPVQKL